MSGRSDSSSTVQVVARNPIKGQTCQLHGQRRLPASNIPTPQQQLHSAGATDGEGQQQCEEGDVGVLRNLSQQTGSNLLMTEGGLSRPHISGGLRLDPTRLQDMFTETTRIPTYTSLTNLWLWSRWCLSPVLGLKPVSTMFVSPVLQQGDTARLSGVTVTGLVEAVILIQSLDLWVLVLIQPLNLLWYWYWCNY